MNIIEQIFIMTIELQVMKQGISNLSNSLIDNLLSFQINIF